MAMVNMTGMTVVHIRVSGKRTKFLVQEFTFGQTVGHTKGNGSITTCMARVFTPGKTGGNTTANTKMTKSTVLEPIPGLMDASTPDSGKMGSNMARGNMSYLQVWNEKGTGTKANVSSGSTRALSKIIPKEISWNE